MTPGEGKTTVTRQELIFVRLPSLLIALVVMWWFFSFLMSAFGLDQVRQDGQAPPSLGVGYNQVMEGLDQILVMEPAVPLIEGPAAGQLRFTGSANHALLEITGPKERTYSASITFLSLKGDEGLMSPPAMLVLFLRNIFPDQSDISSLTSRAIKDAARTPGKERAIRTDGKVIRVMIHEGVGWLTVSVKPG